jgi:hypothetical protein
MSNYSYLLPEFEAFKDSISTLTDKGGELLKETVNTEEDFSAFKIEELQWEEDGQKLLSEAFAHEKNSFLYEFINTRAEHEFHLTQIGSQRPLVNRVKKIKDTIQKRIEYLYHNVRIIEYCDRIQQGDKFDINSRRNYKMTQKLDLLLDRLYKLNDGGYYPIEMLLEGNGITLNNSTESREILQMLEDNDYIHSLGGLGMEPMARITTRGSMYVEEKSTPYSNNYDDISSEKKDIESRVDEIIEHLEKMGLGQEILFEELQELKELYGKLSKRNWGQIVKGKLVDLALAKLIENDTVSYIYEKLTGHDLRLP